MIFVFKNITQDTRKRKRQVDGIKQRFNTGCKRARDTRDITWSLFNNLSLHDAEHSGTRESLRSSESPRKVQRLLFRVAVIAVRYPTHRKSKRISL